MFNISIKNLKEKINQLTKKDIADFASKYNIYLSREELDFVYNLVKKHHQEFINNPKNFNLNNYKNNFSENNFFKLNNLYNKYSNYLNLIKLTD